MAYLSAARSFWSKASMAPRGGETVQQPLPTTQFLPCSGGPITTGFLFKTSVPPPISVVLARKRLLLNQEGRSKLAFTRCSMALGMSRRKELDALRMGGPRALSEVL
jgi:hypothetical protein